jgi:hypothetical protein
MPNPWAIVSLGIADEFPEESPADRPKLVTPPQTTDGSVQNRLLTAHEQQPPRESTSRIERPNFGWNKSAIGRLYACGKSSAPTFYVALKLLLRVDAGLFALRFDVGSTLRFGRVCRNRI